MEPSEQPGPLRRLLGRPWVLTLLYLLIAVALAAMGWSGLWSMFSLLQTQAAPWLTLLTAVPASGVVLLKRRAPGVGLLISVGIFAVDLVTFGGLVPLLVVLEMMHARLLDLDAVGRRRALGWASAAVAGLVLLALLLTGDLRITAMLALQFGALFGFSYWYANSIAQSRELVQLYRQRSETAERLAVLDRESAVQGERDRMARELHDVVAGHISAVAIRSEAALSAGEAGGHQNEGQHGGQHEDHHEDQSESIERRALRAVRDSSLEAHGALRSMIRVLRSGERHFEVPPGLERLPELVAAANESGVRARLIDETRRVPSTPVDQAIGRIVQEALANCVRHASGADVEVRLGEQGTLLHVAVVSSGGRALASPELAGSGMGIDLLAERVRALGGQFVAGPEGRGVWAVRAAIPRGDSVERSG